MASRASTGLARQERDLQRLRAAIEVTADAIFLIDPDSMMIVWVNAAACELSGYVRAELLSISPETLFSSPRETLQAAWQALIDGDQASAAFEALHRRADGAHVSVQVRRHAVRVDNAWLIVHVARDITIPSRVERALQLQVMQQGLLARFGQLALENPPMHELMTQAIEVLQQGLGAEFSRLLEAGPDDLVLHHVAGIGWAEHWLHDLSFSAVDETQNRFVLGARESILISDFDVETRQKRSAILSAHGVRSAVEVLICGAGGAYGVIGAYSRGIASFGFEAAQFVQGLSNTLAAAIERKHTEDRMARMAQFDALTDLPNRNLYLDRLGQSLVEAERDKRPVGVLFVDIDRFKNVNDSFGHSTGDLLLVEIAARLQAAVRPGDTVGRLGGDEFAIALAHLAHPEDAAQVAQKIVNAIAAPSELGAHRVYVSASIGIGLFPNDGKEPDTLLRNADIAMYRAKESGRNACQFYLPAMNERALGRMRLESELRGALQRDEFVLHYQPKVSLSTGKISGLEALLRWKPAGRALVSPAEFIPLLEDTGLIVPIGKWVIATVCAQVRRWQSAGLAPPPVAVNLSARQFQQDDVAASIAALLAASGMDPALLEIELTESILMSDAESAVQALQKIKALGVGLSLDDFGTGYSSLAYLRRFPLDALKIDRAFIRDVGTDADDGTIARAIINLAASLRLKVIAEGVETEAQIAFLHTHGCDEMQGFYFSRPLPVDEMARLLRDGVCLALPP